jgi:hypothetical protein
VTTRLFDVNPFAGTKTIWHDLCDGQYALETVGDVETALEINKARFNDSNRHQIGGEAHGVMAASIPLVVYEDLMRRGIAQDNAAMIRWLNDRDNRLFRTHEMRV